MALIASKSPRAARKRGSFCAWSTAFCCIRAESRGGAAVADDPEAWVLFPPVSQAQTESSATTESKVRLARWIFIGWSWLRGCRQPYLGSRHAFYGRPVPVAGRRVTRGPPAAC